MPKKVYQDYHKALMDQGTYPSAPRKIKFEESRLSYLYRTGEAVYKIRKTSPVYSSLALKERFCREALELGRYWAGEMVEAVVPIVKTQDGFRLDGQGEVMDYALRMRQLSDHYWLVRLLEHGKVTQTSIGRLARFLAEHHELAAVMEKTPLQGRMEHFESILEEVFYQSKKYIGMAISEAVLETIHLPMHRYMEEFRKLFLRRQKKHRIVAGHGAFLPEHIYLKGTEVAAFSPLEGQPKFRLLDCANDVASLMNALSLADAEELGEVFLKRYITASKDRDLPKILPAYRTMQAMHQGLIHCEFMAEQPEADSAWQEAKAQAEKYYGLAVKCARGLPRPE